MFVAACVCELPVERGGSAGRGSGDEEPVAPYGSRSTAVDPGVGGVPL